MEPLEFNPRAKECIERSKTVCTELGGTAVHPMDIFLATVLSRYEPIISFLNTCTSDPVLFIKESYEYCKGLKRIKKKKISWGRESSRIINLAHKEAQKDGTAYIGVDHLFLSCIRNSAKVREFLEAVGIDDSVFYVAFTDFCMAMHTSSPQEHLDSQHGQMKTVNMDKYCDHINSRVMRNKFKFYGRMEEINDAMNALCRKQKSNVLFVGEAGVGKTAIVEGLALAMEDPPKNSEIAFLKMDIFELKLTDMVAGAVYRGEFEKRLNATLDEIKSLPSKTVIFIDEIHMVVGAGDREGAMDAANILKPALANGEISCIGATTYAEYKKYIEKDSALARRFEVIHIKEPSIKETYDIISNCKSSYEEYHSVKFSEDAVKALVNAADEHVPYRRFPDKAFDLLDEAGTFFKLRHCKRPDDLIKRELELREFVDSEGENIEEIGRYDKKMNEFRQDMEEWTDSIKKSTDIKVSNVKSFVDKKFKLNNKKFDLRTSLNKNVLGQDRAIKSFCSFIQIISRQKRKNKPKFSVLLAGPHGVGKTLLCQEYAKQQPLGIDGSALFDMSHYSDATSINKMIGSSAGYVGYDKGGVLTEKLKNNPNIILFFENIEKAHPSIVDLIAQIINDGSLQDNIGQKIDCSRCSIFLSTSQINKRSVGFGSNDSESPELELDSKKIPANILGAIDKYIILPQLNVKTFQLIVRRHMEESPFDVDIDEDVFAFVSGKCSIELGARPLLSAVDEFILSPLYEFESHNKIKKSEGIHIKMLDNSINISIFKREYEKSS
jgi:ATP-dependent Clp protease ATP-binding subunit ClpC